MSMDFDVFDKLSELETKIHLLNVELSEKDTYIELLKEQNDNFRQQLEILTNQIETKISNQDAVKANKQSSIEKPIAEILKETSESVMQVTGYVFDQQTGLYFDRNSGYYYDPENQLFFEPRSGVYYSYNSETLEYSFHSRVSNEMCEKFKNLFASQSTRTTSENETRSIKQRSRRHSSSYSSSPNYRSRRSSSIRPHRRRRRRYSRSRSGRYHRRRYRVNSSDSRTSSHHSYRKRSQEPSGHHHRYKNDHDNDSNDQFQNLTEEEEKEAKMTCVAASPVIYPPSLRLMVISSTYLKPGSVGVFTSQQATSGWACLGRNTTYCPTFNFMEDPDIEEIHCEFNFNKSNESYSIKDRKTLSGTYINGQKLQCYEKKVLCHGDVLRISVTRLLIHIHSGCETCSQCEPDNSQVDNEVLLATDLSIKPTITVSNTQIGFASKEALRRAKLNELKSKYNLKIDKYAAAHVTRTNNVGKYLDRAAVRRQSEKRVSNSTKKDFHHEAVNCQASDNQTAMSVYTPIDDANVGAKILTKMGWNRGEGLGKEKSGISEPVSASIRINPHAGLGSSHSHGGIITLASIDATPASLLQAQILATTQQRYRQIEIEESSNKK